MPARVLMQDFTGVPAIVDLAAMRDAVVDLGGDPDRVDPAIPVDLVIDHSIVVDVAGVPDAFARNADARVRAQRGALHVPPVGAGRVPHAARVPSEPRHLPPGEPRVPRPGRVPRRRGHRVSRHARRHRLAHADGQRSRRARLGRRRHRGRGGDARPAAVAAAADGRRDRAAGRRCPRARPPPTSCSPSRSCCASTASSASSSSSTAKASAASRSRTGRRSATCRPSTARRARSSRSTTRRCATCARPVDPTISSRSSRRTRRNRGCGTTPRRGPVYDETLALDLSTVEPSLAGSGPTAGSRRAHRCARRVRKALLAFRRQSAGPGVRRGAVRREARHGRRDIGQVVPGERSRRGRAGCHRSRPARRRRRARRARSRGRWCAARSRSRSPTGDVRDHRRPRRDRRDHVVHEHVEPVGDDRRRAAGARTRSRCGLTVPPWVKTSLAPGSLVVTDYYERAGLLEPLAALGFHVVGYGCTTCIGNSGPLAPEISQAITEGDLSVASVLSGNRNFEGRIHPDCRMNYLASPPLVVAYALAGTMDRDLRNEPLGQDPDGTPVYLRDIWPTSEEVAEVVERGARDEHVHAPLRGSARRRRALAGPRRARPASASRGTTRPRTSASRRSSKGCERDRGAAGRHRRRAGARAARRQRDDRPHLARRRDPARRSGGAVAARSRRGRAPTSTPTARVAAITR